MRTPGEPRSRSRGNVDRVLAPLAAAQHGLVTRAQLVELGLSASGISRRLDASRLHSVRPGVYAVGHPALSPRGALLAAVLACGEGAVLSHRSAAELWELAEPRAGFAPQVTVPHRKVGGPAGIRTHATQLLAGSEIDRLDGIPVTSVTRTLLDFAGQTGRAELARAYEQALIRGLTSRELVVDALVRHRGRRGIRKIRALIDRDAPPSVTRSVAEHRLLELIRGSSLPHPETNVVVGGFEVDFLWRDPRVVVEMDGAAFHSTPDQVEFDRARDAELASLGYVVLRVTWRQLTREPDRVLARIQRAIRTRTPAETAIEAHPVL